MPYTLAHPAIILPFYKIRSLTLAGLFIGAMSPDFEHILRLNVVSTHSHTLPGLLYFCLPVGLIVVWLYRSTWIYALSDYFEIPAAKPAYWKDAVSVFFGACSHLFWDSFTHKGRWGVRTFPILDTELAPDIALWHFLQLACSIVGLAILTAFFWKSARQIPKFVLISVALTLFAVALTFVIHPELSPKMMAVHTSNNFMAVAAVALTVIGIRQKRKPRSG